MKKIILLILILCTATVYGAENKQNISESLLDEQKRILAEQSKTITANSQVLINTSCDSYISCYELFRYEETPSLIRLFYAKDAKINKFNIMDDYIVKIQDAGCPIKFDVYKKDNNINILLDTFNYTSYNDACVTYITNLTGSGINSKNVVSQLEIKYCPKDTSHRNFCDKGIVFAKVIGFDNTEEDELTDLEVAEKDKQSKNGSNILPERNQYLQNVTEIDPEDVEKELDKQRRSIGGYTPINNKPEAKSKETSKRSNFKK